MLHIDPKSGHRWNRAPPLIDERDFIDITLHEEHALEVQRQEEKEKEEWAMFEGWLIRRVATCHMPKGQKRPWWGDITKHLSNEFTPEAKQQIPEDMLGWTFHKEAPAK
jgi:hypothetical protein